MDKLYTGDIPQEYHYAKFNSNYIDLYDTEVLQPNSTYTYYRVYMYDNLFMYDTLVNTTSGYYLQTNTDIEVTDNFMYRRDFPSILTILLIIVLFLVFCTNVITSVVRKGGVLGGLL